MGHMISSFLWTPRFGQTCLVVVIYDGQKYREKNPSGTHILVALTLDRPPSRNMVATTPCWTQQFYMGLERQCCKFDLDIGDYNIQRYS
ncbi:hypothetical protein PoB_003693300 [Plakobranchus ocellatus]|uniref:Uncharacterized protein n=1 Tax=Plakobranchus ocellatus TaxID=259542 RepID=A0AAV4AUC7_9GAST|nr:hypothetical protein PoB_003693300 [Plakobranchus ocellatus]